MRKLICTLFVTSFIALSVSSVMAADVSGTVKTKVKIEKVIQKNEGIGNTNELVAGSVTGETTNVSGTVKTKVKVNKVIQKNSGIGNKNSAVLGSVTD